MPVVRRVMGSMAVPEPVVVGAIVVAAKSVGVRSKGAALVHDSKQLTLTSGKVAGIADIWCYVCIQRSTAGACSAGPYLNV